MTLRARPVFRKARSSRSMTAGASGVGRTFQPRQAAMADPRRGRAPLPEAGQTPAATSAGRWKQKFQE